METLGRNDLGVMVKEGCQGQGIGDRLLENILYGREDVSLYVMSSNEPAKALYEKHGFVTEHKLDFMRRK